MQFSHERAVWAELRSEGIDTALPQSKQTHQNVLGWVLIGYECLPSFISYIVSSNQLDVFRLDLVMHFFDTNLSRPDISAWKIHLLHLSQSQFPQITFLHTRCHKRHRDISLHSIDSNPRRDKRQELGDNLNKFVRMVVAIFAVFPQLVEPSATDDQGGIDLDSIGPEAGVLEEFFERLEIPL